MTEIMSRPTLDKILELVAQFEDHDETARYSIIPEDWLPENGNSPFTERFVYIGESANVSGFPSNSLLEIKINLDRALCDYVLDEKQQPIQENVNELLAAGRPIALVTAIEGDTSEQPIWLTFSIKTKHGLYLV